MPGAKRAISGKKNRTQVVPVRVVKSTAPRRTETPASVTTERLRPRRKLPKSERDRRTLMWAGVVLVALIVFIAWIGFVRSDLARQSGSDNLLGKIRSELSAFFGKLKLFKSANDNTNAVDPELQDLRNRVFPEIKDQQFTTNGNRNPNQ